MRQRFALPHLPWTVNDSRSSVVGLPAVALAKAGHAFLWQSAHFAGTFLLPFAAAFT